MKINKKNKKGFTLIEVVVALAVFTIIIISASGAFASIFKVYKDARDLGENVKNSQYAVGLLGKTLRTSTIIGTTNNTYATQITLFDYSRQTQQCIRYAFSSGRLTELKNTVADVDACKTNAFTGTPVDMTTGYVTGSFYTVKTEGKDSGTTGTAGEIGKVSIRLYVKNRSTDSDSKYAKLQTSVSLRDYTQSNVGIDIAR